MQCPVTLQGNCVRRLYQHEGSNMLTYYKSGILNKNFAVDAENKIVYIDDYTIPIKNEKAKQISYFFDELKIIDSNIGEITPEIHIIKKVFPSEIINHEKTLNRVLK